MLAWLAPDHFDAKRAVTCLEVPPGMESERVAVQLKQILDARGHYVPVPSMSGDANYADEEGRHRIVPVPDFPVLVLERGADEQWRYSSKTLAQVPGLYEQTFSPFSLWFQSQLPEIFFIPVIGIFLWQYLYALLLLGAAVLVGQVVRLLLRTQVRRFVSNRLKITLNESTYSRTNRPLVVVAMSAIFLWGVADLQLNVSMSSTLHGLGWLVFALAMILSMVRFLEVFSEIGQDVADKSESKLDDQLIPLLHQAARTLLYAVGMVVVLDAFGVDVWKLAAGVGIGGLAFALAAQDTVANFFGSINIFVDRPFQIGDSVVIGSVEGVVEEVGFRSTRVRTFHNSVVTIPNSAITNANVDNMGRRNRRRVRLILQVNYNTPPDTVQAFVMGVRAILAANPVVERTYEVHFYNMGDSGLEILVHYHVKVPGWNGELVARSNTMMEMMRLAERLNVKFAYPSTSLYLESTPDQPVGAPAPFSPNELEQVASSFGPDGEQARPAGPAFERNWSVQDRESRSDKY
jgi:MscS family membrane protein